MASNLCLGCSGRALKAAVEWCLEKNKQCNIAELDMVLLDHVSN